MLMTFPHAGNYQIPRALFIAAWKVWFKRFDDHYAWREGKMPLQNLAMPLHQLLVEKQRFSVEVACRLMVPWSYRDCRQVSDEMLKMNPAVLRLVPYTCGDTGDTLEGARLTDQALDYWDSLTHLEQDVYLNFAEARIQADIETPCDAPVILDDAGVELIGEDIYPPYVPTADSSDDEFIRALVAWVDEDPFQPMYQRKPVGDAVSGWHDRLLAFFWPKPRTGYLEYSHIVSPVLYRAGVLAESVETDYQWNYQERELAVKVANEVFLVAGVPQREVTWQNVREAVKAALTADVNSKAKMNSGWTYLACLATAHLEGKEGRLPMVCWNSRSASSIISRLDFLLVEAGVEELGDRFAHIGLVPGWGGTRPREYSLKWQGGYRSWHTQVAASQLVQKICHFLNTEKNDNGELKYKPMPTAGGKHCPWTTRGVQLVLFSDGY
ncbi:hypothetical protein [Pleionea sp. CnH1-48]|uniref:hypothetical protein n=1 Tax=Pleionea sp. CnH1-48 TaxID=2954494 RepID=UPI002096A9B7|nr:hypothetical protein [Pleionea sp. CnH1-48]MCO7226006.1 hypothetical protein [Pleionea sp. CnH1-48]